MDAAKSNSSDPIDLHTSTGMDLVLSKDVIQRLPGLDELDRKLLDRDFSPLAFIDSQLTNMSATQLRETLQNKLETIKEQTTQTTLTANVTVPLSVDVSKVNDMYNRGRELVSQAVDLDGRLAAIRNRLVQVLHLRDTLMSASSTLVLSRAYISQVSSLPSNLERALADLSSTTQRLAFIKLIEKRIEPYASIPAVGTCMKQFSSYTSMLLSRLPPIQGSPTDDSATFWTEAMPHMALGTVLQGHKSLAAIVVDRGQLFSSNTATDQAINEKVKEIALSIQKFQHLVNISTPYLSKLEDTISHWVHQAYDELETISMGLSVTAESAYNTSLLLAIYEAYLSSVRKNLTRLLKVVTIGNDNGAFTTAAIAFVAFEMDLRRGSDYEQLAILFPELKKPILSGLFVPLFSSLVLSDLDSNISKLKLDSLNILSAMDFSGFNIYNGLPPPQVVSILRVWKSFLQQTSAFLDNNARLYVSEAVVQCMKELAGSLLEQLNFPADSNLILQKRYAQINGFPIQHSLLNRSPCKQMTIYDPSELLVVPLVPRVIATVYGVLWSISTFENNISGMILSHLAIASEGAINAQEIEHLNQQSASSEYENICIRQRSLLEGLQETWNTVADTAMRTLAGVMAGELCSGGVYPLLESHPNGKQDFRRVQTLITGQFELFLDTFKAITFPNIFAEILIPAICNAVGCCVVAAPKTKEPLISILSSIKELIHDIGHIVTNVIPSRLYETISNCVEEKVVGVLSFLLLILENRKATTHKQLADFLPMCTDTKQWFAELTRLWTK
ncbi:Hypothetical protein GLP15_3323 [Giardia lamblia P15]|uniref:Uncharacterized protein n=1 Tax=Giardia intestinalis (strain P15) TaxID=658858 RepID=E1F9C6_GIAIA|nr:Hypothetical protein GLP15_3323 [Giardia lamblia P15]